MAKQLSLEPAELLRMIRCTVSSSVALLWILLAGWVGVIPLCWAQSDATSPDARAILKRGTVEAGGVVGYWEEFLFPTEAHSSTRRGILVMPRVGMVVTDEVEAGVLSGNLAVQLEPVYGRFKNTFTGHAAGAAMVVKYQLLSFGRWMPFWDVGVGVLWTDLAPRIAEDSSQVNFSLETGPGTQYYLTARTALTLGVRYHHISNAGIGTRNLGLDAVLPYGGISWMLSN
ncbi:MAG TPA: acyloxyacyl hydrolase [Nitrospira sp.]|nr:acyloxyacyl hydrolase [Nitrospira sp.]